MSLCQQPVTIFQNILVFFMIWLILVAASAVMTKLSNSCEDVFYMEKENLIAKIKRMFDQGAIEALSTVPKRTPACREIVPRTRLSVKLMIIVWTGWERHVLKFCKMRHSLYYSSTNNWNQTTYRQMRLWISYKKFKWLKKMKGNKWLI